MLAEVRLAKNDITSPHYDFVRDLCQLIRNSVLPNAEMITDILDGHERDLLQSESDPIKEDIVGLYNVRRICGSFTKHLLHSLVKHLEWRRNQMEIITVVLAD